MLISILDSSRGYLNYFQERFSHLRQFTLWLKLEPLVINFTMGLFSSVIHVKGASTETVCKALSDTVPRLNFRFIGRRAATRPLQDTPRESLLYLVSPLQGSWTTILEGHFAVRNAPGLTELANSLSAALETYTLALMVHDDDVLFYNLYRKGAGLDGYNSNPQYFESARLSEQAVAEQQHDPHPFEPLLPGGVSLSHLQEVLDRGWWSAYKSGRLDADGVQPPDESGFLFEGERMIAIGNLLQLHGNSDGYPFAGWADDPSIEWHAFQELQFERA